LLLWWFAHQPYERRHLKRELNARIADSLA
jgi:hypothetical protein